MRLIGFGPRVGVVVWLMCLVAGQAFAACNPKKPAPPVADRFLIQGATVKDKLTGLTWQRCSLGQKWKEKIGCVGVVAEVNFAEAQDEEADGWRLPRPAELRSLVIGRCTNPAITEEAFPDMDPQFLWYWAYDGKLEQVVNFGSGNPSYCASTRCKGNAVRLVKREIDPSEGLR